MGSNEGIKFCGFQIGRNFKMRDIIYILHKHYPKGENAKKNISKELRSYFLLKCGQITELIGLEGNLSELRNLLKSHHVVRIVGRAGSGKTSLAIRHALDGVDNDDLYKYILWFDAESRDSFHRSIKDIIGIMDIDDSDGKTDEVLLSKIYASVGNSTAVIIFDNVVRSFSVSRFVPKEQHGIKTLITSQIHEQGICTNIEMNVLDKKNGIKLIQQNIGYDLLPDYKDKLLMIINKLHGLPIEFLHIAAVIRNTPRNRLHFVLDDYMQNLDQYINIPLDEEEDKLVIDIISKTLEELFKSNCDINMVNKILFVLSHINPGNIKPQLFYDLNFKKEIVDQSLLLLEKYSILSKASNGVFSIHRLVQVTIRIKGSNRYRGIIGLLFWIVDWFLGSGENQLYRRLLKLMLSPEYLPSGHHDNVFTHLHEDFNDESFFTELSGEEQDNYINSLAKHGCIKNLQKLSNQVDAKNIIRKGITLIHASWNGCLECVKFLVSIGASVNAKDLLGRTALMVSSLNGQKEVVEHLLENQADIHATDHDGRTAILHAFQCGDADIIKLLEEKDADVFAETRKKQNALHIAAYSGHLELVEDLVINRGFDVNSKDLDGHTPLMDSCLGGHEHVMKFLLDNKADVDQTTIKCVIEIIRNLVPRSGVEDKPSPILLVTLVTLFWSFILQYIFMNMYQ